MRIPAACVVLVACASTRPSAVKPESMTASEHLAQAREHSEAARSEARTYPAPYSSSSYPWYYYWNPGEDHRALAAAHRDAADELRLSYEAACASVPRDRAASSPLDRYSRSMHAMAKGVVFHLHGDAGAPEAVLAELRCHRAWLMLEHTASQRDNPLLVPGIVFVVHAGGDGIEVMIGVDDLAQLPELTRRAQLTIERRPRT